MSDVLVVMAHPDDEVLGCGGTIARLTTAGNQVHICFLVEGITSRRVYGAEGTARLEGVSQQVATLLGAQRAFWYRLPDNKLDTVPLLTVVQSIEEAIDLVEPRVIYTHSGGDLNIDHSVVHRSVLTATRPMKGVGIEEIYACEIASSTEWAFGQFWPAFWPNVFVDISATLETKVQAMALYESEVRQWPHPRSPEAIRAAARHWGSAVGLEAAEPFQLIRRVWR